MQRVVADFVAAVQRPHRPDHRLLTVAVDVLVVELVHAQLRPLEGDHAEAVDDGGVQQTGAAGRPGQRQVGTGAPAADALLLRAEVVVDDVARARLVDPGDGRVCAHHARVVVVLAQAKRHVLARVQLRHQLHHNVIAVQYPADLEAAVVAQYFAVQFALGKKVS